MPLMINALIIEDEPNGQELLSSLLKAYCPNVQILGIVSSVKKGIALIQEEKPDLVFMDYQIEGGNGFDILDAFSEPWFKVIFITGYSEYAIKAIKYAALDYLLKPIDIEELTLAVNRFDSEMTNYSNNYKSLKSSINQTESQLKQLVIPSKGEYKVINIEDICYVKAIQSFVEIRLKENIRIISSEPLKHYEALLPTADFFQVHKSYLINLKTVESIDQGRGGQITLFSGERIPIATRRKALFIKKLKDFSQ